MDKQPRIVIVGSLNMDLVVDVNDFPQIGETKSGQSISYLSGGKGANQAVGCARLDAHVSLIGAVGNDLFGQQILSQLATEGIDITGVKRVNDVPTGVANIIHTPKDNSIIVISGANGALSPQDVYLQREIIASTDVLLIQLEIPLETVQEAVSIAKQAGIITILNPAPAQKLPLELLQSVDYITPNEIEFSQLSGTEIGELNDSEIKLIVSSYSNEIKTGILLSRGEKGACLYKNGAWYEQKANIVDVVDTTGAGDCLNATFATMLGSGNELEDALRLAVTAASISVTKYGAQEGMPKSIGLCEL